VENEHINISREQSKSEEKINILRSDKNVTTSKISMQYDQNIQIHEMENRDNKAITKSKTNKSRNEKYEK